MKWKHWVRYPSAIRAARRAMASRAAFDQGQRSGHVSLAVDIYGEDLLFDCGRHLTCLAASAHQLGRRFYLRSSRMMLAAIAHKQLGRDLLALPNVEWIESERGFPVECVVLLDVARQHATRDLSGQRPVRMLIGRDFVDGIPVMPYPMFPVHTLRSTPRSREMHRVITKAGVFFAGNQKSRYGRDRMRAEFGILPRLAVLETLREEFPERIAECSSDGNVDRIVLRDSSTHPIQSDDWIRTIAQHQFFLCCPGASQPVCHHLIEAMSVGTVPILEYSSRMTPHLVDGQNAICFEGRSGLADAIRRIDAMSARTLRNLSDAAADYYDRHLDGQGFLSRVLDHGLLSDSGAVLMPFHDRNLFDPSSLKTLRRSAA
ncbi:MAG: hypothetical protein AAFX06_11715 [Planctomycetota bacterium]